MAFSNRSIWPSIVGILFGVPLLYVLSFGPVCWWIAPRGPAVFDAAIAPLFYWPIGSLALDSRPGVFFRLINWYATLLQPDVEVPYHYSSREFRLPLSRDSHFLKSLERE